MKKINELTIKFKQKEIEMGYLGFENIESVTIDKGFLVVEYYDDDEDYIFESFSCDHILSFKYVEFKK